MRFLFLTISLALVTADLLAFYNNVDLASCFEEIWLVTCLVGLFALTAAALFDGPRTEQDAQEGRTVFIL